MWNDERGFLWGTLAGLLCGAFLGLLLFGATMPLIAWTQYFRIQRSLSWFEAVAMVVGGLALAASLAYGAAWLRFQYGWAATIWAVLVAIGLICTPIYIIRQRKLGKHIRTIDGTSRRLK
ncbi:hypothetical protein [Chitiniphilus eburneus]|uniref:hypothetical protein n=1 Tax=Chitiniphilus eburneus TaxID=2571148 RepID=UPI0035D1184E